MQKLNTSDVVKDISYAIEDVLIEKLQQHFPNSINLAILEDVMINIVGRIIMGAYIDSGAQDLNICCNKFTLELAKAFKMNIDMRNKRLITNGH